MRSESFAPPANPAHAHVDLAAFVDENGYSNKQGKAKARLLARAATDRRCVYPVQ